MKNLIIVTHNEGKFAEVSAIASRHGVKMEMPESVEKLEIQANSLVEVASFSAAVAYERIKKPLVVDDSGLFIKSLSNFPGVYSSSTFDTLGNRGILKLLKNVKDRSAYFECAVAYYDGNKLRTFIERTDGTILQSEKGSGMHGFGYDPVFSPDGHKGKSLAQVDLLKKNKVSHRGKAFEAFFKWYSK